MNAEATQTTSLPHGLLSEIEGADDGTDLLAPRLPELARLSGEGRWIAWIAPPRLPSAACLAAQGIDPAKVLLIHPRRPGNAVWAMEQALRSGTCAAVLAWSARPEGNELHRLRLAAEAGGSWGLLFHHHDTIVQGHTPLRLRLQPSRPERLPSRRRGGTTESPGQLSLSEF